MTLGSTFTPLCKRNDQMERIALGDSTGINIRVMEVCSIKGGGEEEEE